MEFIYETPEGFVIDNTKNSLYSDYIPDGLKYLSLPISESLKEFSTFTIEDEDDDDFFYEFEDYDIKGGKKESKKSLLVNKKIILKVMPSYINVLKGKIFYKKQTKMPLKPFEPKKSDNITVGIVIDLKKVKQILEKEDISIVDIIQKYVNEYDIIPLIFNFNEKNIVYKNRKQYFFSKDSKLIFITFNIVKKTDFYYEDVLADPYDNFIDIEDVIKSGSYMVAHYIYENYYLFCPSPKTHLKLDKCYLIDIDNQDDNKKLLIDITDTKGNIFYESNKRKVSLNEMTNILNICKNKLTIFS